MRPTLIWLLDPTVQFAVVATDTLPSTHVVIAESSCVSALDTPAWAMALGTVTDSASRDMETTVYDIGRVCRRHIM